MSVADQLNKALARARALAKEHTRNLEDTARAFALGRATTEDLLAAAKKATNANHAVGRLSK